MNDEVELSRQPVWQLLLQLWRISPLKITLLAIVTWGAALLPGLQVALTASLVNNFVDVVESGTSLIQLTPQLTAITAISVGIAVGSSLAAYLASVVSAEVVTETSKRVTSKASALRLENFEDPKIQDRLQRAVVESRSGRPFELMSGFIQTVGQVVTVVSISVPLFAWSPLAALLALVGPVPSALIALHYGRVGWRIELERTQQRRLGAYLQSLIVTDQSFKEVAHYRLGGELRTRHATILDRIFHVDRGYHRSAESAGLVGRLCAVLATVGALVLALISAAGSGNIGSVAGFVQALGSLQGTMHGVLSGMSALYSNALFAANMFDFLALPAAPVPSGSRPFPDRLTTGIRFEKVSFTYPGTQREVLHGVDLEVPSGTKIALVGANGSGKSTLIKLLLRLYEPSSGRILIDEVPIEEYDISALRRGIAAVFQDYVKYELPLRDNVRFGAIDEEDPDVSRALAAAGASGLLSNLPHGFDTVLGKRFDGGEQLSIGQWQKLAIARSMASKAKVLVMDEPSAALDAHAEADLFKTLTAAAEGRTTLVIAHRFSTIRKCTSIVVLAGGRVKERGTHEELMRLAGEYARTFEVQSNQYAQEERTLG